MTAATRAALTLGIFAATLALVILKPRGRSEAIWTVLGGAAFLGLGLVTPRDVVAVTLSGKGALLFLLALLLLSASCPSARWRRCWSSASRGRRGSRSAAPRC